MLVTLTNDPADLGKRPVSSHQDCACDCQCACPTDGAPIPVLSLPVAYYLELTPACTNRCPGCGNVYAAGLCLAVCSSGWGRVVRADWPVGCHGLSVQTHRGRGALAPRLYGDRAPDRGLGGSLHPVHQRTMARSWPSDHAAANHRHLRGIAGVLAWAGCSHARSLHCSPWLLRRDGRERPARVRCGAGRGDEHGGPLQELGSHRGDTRTEPAAGSEPPGLQPVYWRSFHPCRPQPGPVTCGCNHHRVAARGRDVRCGLATASLNASSLHPRGAVLPAARLLR